MTKPKYTELAACEIYRMGLEDGFQRAVDELMNLDVDDTDVQQMLIDGRHADFKRLEKESEPKPKRKSTGVPLDKLYEGKG